MGQKQEAADRQTVPAASRCILPGDRENGEQEECRQQQLPAEQRVYGKFLRIAILAQTMPPRR